MTRDEMLAAIVREGDFTVAMEKKTKEFLALLPKGPELDIKGTHREELAVHNAALVAATGIVLAESCKIGDRISYLGIEYAGQLSATQMQQYMRILCLHAMGLGDALDKSRNKEPG